MSRFIRDFKMSQSENCENLLIDFNNTTVSNEPSSDVDQIKLINESMNDSSSKKRAMNEILCSSQPLYKLLTESNDADGGNNPFDHFDKQAGLLDDPFEIVANAALIASPNAAATTQVGEMTEVKTATLISFDSTMSDTSRSMLTLNDSNQSNEEKLNNSVQNTSQKQIAATKTIPQKSPSVGGSSTRSKAKNTLVTLLKTVLSNSRLDLIAADNNVSASSENVCVTNNALQKKQQIEMRRDSGTDDSFDDIWSTIPNLIDSQTEIDVESDIDNDIAKLNIPMLKISTPSSHCEENAADDPVETIETKALNRSNMLEKFASIKQKIPAPIDMTAVATSSPLLLLPTMPVHNQTVDIPNGDKSCVNINSIANAPSTPYSPIEPVHQYQQEQQQKQPPPTMTNNPDSLIENLQKLVDQCNDKDKQLTAKHLLDDLSSILAKSNANANEKNNASKADGTDRQPPKIKRQGTFNIDRDSCSYLVNKNAAEDETICSIENGVKNETQVIDSEFSQVVKQIQNAFGSHQNINVLHTNDQPLALSGEGGSVNPTVIFVMAPPQTPLAQRAAATAIDYGEESGFSRFQRNRSQSLSLKERSLAAMRASQQKAEHTRAQMSAQTTPIKGTVGQRRRSFSTITQPAINTDTQPIVKPPANQQPEASKFIRRRSLHGPIEKANEPTIVQSNLQNPITRRRSLQAPSLETGIRLPSPKKSFNLGRSSNAPIRQNAHAMGTLTRRKSFNIGETIKDSPLKIKTSYGIMKKPAAPSASRNLKIRVTQSTTGRATAPLRAVVPVKQVAPLHLINDTVAPVDVQKMSTLITSTPRSIPSPIKSKKGKRLNQLLSLKWKFYSENEHFFLLFECINLDPLSTSALPQESPIQTLHEKNSYLSTPPNISGQPTISNVGQRRRTISDYRSEVNSSVTVPDDSNTTTAGKISSFKNATRTLATGLSRFTAKRMVRKNSTFEEKKIWSSVYTSFSSFSVKHWIEAAHELS